MQSADHVLVPLLDATFGVAQIEQDRALVYMTDSRGTPAGRTRPLNDTDVVAALRVALPDLGPDQWPVFDNDTVPRLDAFDTVFLGWVDPIDPAIIEAVASAIHGLHPWDGLPDPAYLTNLLRDSATLPAAACMTADFPTPPQPEA
jgi:hypothetical protein